MNLATIIYKPHCGECGHLIDTEVAYQDVYTSPTSGIMEENRLDKTISDVAYILDNLMLLRQIQQTGNCNNCKNRNCGHIPRIGQMVRYNCPFYKKN